MRRQVPRWRPAFTRDALRELAAEVRLRRALVTRRRRRVARRALASWRDAVPPRARRRRALGHWAYRGDPRAARVVGDGARNLRARARRRTADAFARVVAHQRAIASAVAAEACARRLRRTRATPARTATRAACSKKAATGGGKGGGTGGGKGNLRGAERARGTHRGTETPSGSGSESGSESGSVSSVVSVVVRVGETREETRTCRRSRPRVVRESDHAEENGRTRRRVRTFARRRTGGDDEGADRVARGEVSGRVAGSFEETKASPTRPRDENSNVAGARVAPRPRADALARRVRR